MQDSIRASECKGMDGWMEGATPCMLASQAIRPMYVCMYVCVCVCMYVYVCMYVCMSVCMQ